MEREKRIDRVYKSLLQYPTKEERLWYLLTSKLKEITYDDYLQLYKIL